VRSAVAATGAAVCFAITNQTLTRVTNDGVFAAIWALCRDIGRVTAMRTASPAFCGLKVWPYRYTVIEDKALTFEGSAIREFLKATR